MKNKIHQLVETLVDYYGTDDPFEIANRMSVFVYSAELPNETNGFYFEIQDKPMICLNQNVNYPVQGLVCAHELGHIVLHSGLNAFQIEKNTLCISGKYEKEADTFAAHLLLRNLAEIDEITTVGTISSIYGIPESIIQLKFST